MMAPVIAAFCAGIHLQGDGYEACKKLYEAVSVQYGIDRTLNGYAKLTEAKLRQRVSEEVAAATVAFYTVAVRQEVRVSTGDVPFVQSTVVTMRIESVHLTVSWNF
jgi:hypothetical protein